MNTKTTCKFLLAVAVIAMASLGIGAQQIIWSANDENPADLVKDKGVLRTSFPHEFKLFKLDVEPLRQQLFSIKDIKSRHSAVVSLPNADGEMEWFEIWEASNFEPRLQKRFPEIRAFS